MSTALRFQPTPARLADLLAIALLPADLLLIALHQARKGRPKTLQDPSHCSRPPGGFKIIRRRMADEVGGKEMLDGLCQVGVRKSLVDIVNTAGHQVCEGVLLPGGQAHCCSGKPLGRQGRSRRRDTQAGFHHGRVRGHLPALHSFEQIWPVLFQGTKRPLTGVACWSWSHVDIVHGRGGVGNVHLHPQRRKAPLADR